MSEPHYYQKKVLEEKHELDTQIEKLAAFTGQDEFLPRDHPENRLLKEQLEAMKWLSDVLGRRINSWENRY